MKRKLKLRFQSQRTLLRAVTLPKARISQLRSEGSGEEVIAALARAVQTEDGMALELGSGDYIFQYALDAAL